MASATTSTHGHHPAGGDHWASPMNSHDPLSRREAAAARPPATARARRRRRRISGSAARPAGRPPRRARAARAPGTAARTARGAARSPGRTTDMTMVTATAATGGTSTDSRSRGEPTRTGNAGERSYEREPEPLEHGASSAPTSPRPRGRRSATRGRGRPSRCRPGRFGDGCGWRVSCHHTPAATAAAIARPAAGPAPTRPHGTGEAAYWQAPPPETRIKHHERRASGSGCGLAPRPRAARPRPRRVPARRGPAGSRPAEKQTAAATSGPVGRHRRRTNRTIGNHGRPPG